METAENVRKRRAIKKIVYAATAVLHSKQILHRIELN
jgi:hypothetical protein